MREYIYNIKYFEGKDSIVADQLTRLVRDPEINWLCLSKMTETWLRLKWRAYLSGTLQNEGVNRTENTC